jgi:hypothetical protein
VEYKKFALRPAVEIGLVVAVNASFGTAEISLFPLPDEED